MISRHPFKRLDTRIHNEQSQVSTGKSWQPQTTEFIQSGYMPVRNVSLFDDIASFNLFIPEQSDLRALKEIFDYWKILNDKLSNAPGGSRKVNILECITEDLVAFYLGGGRRIPAKTCAENTETKSSVSQKPAEVDGKKITLNFDVYSIHNSRIHPDLQDVLKLIDLTAKAIQVKACGAETDLTSFGPDNKEDYIIFIHFWNGGNINGTFDLYLLTSAQVHSLPHAETNAENGKRPHVRLLKDLIYKEGIQPLATISPW